MEDQAASQSPEGASSPTPPEDKGAADVCLRCNKVIEFVPYKYNQATFHAVCVVCDFCGKKLVAKPFIIQNSTIFCSDQCKKNFEGAAAVSVVVSPPEPSQSSQENMSSSNRVSAATEVEDPGGESLMEVLENINEGKTELTKLSRKSSPLLSPDTYDPDRITDYPRAQSPPGIRSPMDGSRRSSLSAISESSLNSDNSSISFDASKMPTKKILKNPHRKRKHTNNRVRWKDEESDTASMKSFDALSTTSEVIYSRARSGVMDVRKNWKELETSPSRVITSSRHRGLRNHLIHHHSGMPKHAHSSSSLLNSSLSTSPTHSFSQHLLGGSPGSRTGSHYRSGSTSSLPLIPANKEVKNFTSNPPASRPFQHSPSQLTGSAVISPSSSAPQQANLHSTPIPHHQSDSMLLDSAASRRTGEDSRNQSVSSPSFDIDLPYPVLKLDSSNLTDLEESTMEDRKKMHIFQFPQRSPAGKSPPNYAAKFFLDDDDAADYDHLSPIDAPNDDKEMPASEQPSEDKKKDEQKDLREGESEKRDENAYSDQDIEDALGELENASINSSSSSTQEPLPIIPRKNASQDETEIVNETDVSLSMFEKTEHLDWHFSQVSSSPNGSQEIPEETLATTNQQAASPLIRVKRTVPSVLANLESAKDRTRSTTSPANDQVPVDRSTAGRTEFTGAEFPTKSTNGIEPREQERGMVQTKPKPPPVAPKPARKGSGKTAEVLKGSNVATSIPSVPQPPSISKSSAKGEEPSFSQNQALNSVSLVSSDQANHCVPSKKEQSETLHTSSQDDTKSSEESNLSLSPQEIISKDQEQPPPLPKKKKHIRRQDRDIDGQPLPPPMLDTSSSLLDKHRSFTPADVEDILPPPPEFAFPSPSKSPLSDDVFVDRSVLESASNSTLVADSEVRTEVRQTLDVDQLYEKETTLSSSSSSSSLSHRSNNKHSWSVIHHNKAKERSASRSSGSVSPPGSSVGGSSQEDTEGRWINRSRLQDSSSTAAGGNRLSANASSTSARSSSILVPRLTKRTTEASTLEGGRMSNSYPYQSAHRKHNRQYERHFSDKGSNLRQNQEPFVNGATKSNGPLDPKSSHVNSKQHHQSFEQNSRESERDLQLRKVPNRHAPPPPVPPHITAKLSGEERQLLHLTYLGKPRMMKPVVHDTGKHIQEMLAEIDSETSRRQPAYGTCGKCGEYIYQRQELVQSNGLCYHSACFKCASCKSYLHGKKLYKNKSTLLCQKCYQKYGESSSHSGSHRNQQVSDFQTTSSQPTKRQVTSV